MLNGKKANHAPTFPGPEGRRSPSASDHCTRKPLAARRSAICRHIWSADRRSGPGGSSSAATTQLVTLDSGQKQAIRNLGFHGAALHSRSESSAGIQACGARSPVLAADQVRAVWVSPDQGSDHCRASMTTGRSYPPTDSATR